MERQRVLVVEDSPEVASLLERALGEEGLFVQVAATGEAALRKLQENWQLVILDLMLPDLAGERILDFIVQRVDHPPVLVLTARGQLSDKLSLFRRGCDDYLTKPFAFEELLARVRALLRRSPRLISEGTEYEGIRLDPEKNLLTRAGVTVNLTPKEFAICRLLLREPGKVVSRKELMHSVWGLTHEPRTNFIEVHLSNLRKKLGQVDRGPWLQTVRATGVLFGKPSENRTGA